MRITHNITSHKPVSHGGPFSVPDHNPDIVDFSSNINPLGPSNLACRAIKKQLRRVGIYPDSDSIELRKKLSLYTKIQPNQIVVGNGATEIIYNFCQAFLSEGVQTVIPVPTFGEYEAASKLNKAPVTFFKTMNLNENFEELIKKIPKHGCVFVCNPNNPTGVLIPRIKMLELIRATKRKGALVFVDECFIELVPEFDESITKYVKNHDNLFVLRSMTKSFALAGMRLGYGLGSKKIISILNKIKIPWNVSGLAQHAAIASLGDSAYITRSKRFIKKETRFLQDNLSKINGLKSVETSTNFILIKTKMKSKNLHKKLLKENILVRDCSTIRGLGDYYIRIAVRTRKDNQKLVKALERIL